MWNTIKKNILYVAWFQALIATGGSLFLSQVLHWTPCELCWFQRIFMYPLLVILTVAILKPIKDIEYIILPLTCIGGLISVYHNLLMYRILPESFAPCTASVSCTIPYHFFFGFLTIPLLALIAFIVISISLLIYRKEKIKLMNV